MRTETVKLLIGSRFRYHVQPRLASWLVKSKLARWADLEKTSVIYDGPAEEIGIKRAIEAFCREKKRPKVYNGGLVRTEHSPRQRF